MYINIICSIIIYTLWYYAHHISKGQKIRFRNRIYYTPVGCGSKEAQYDIIYIIV